MKSAGIIVKKIIYDLDNLLFDLPRHHSDRLSFSFTEALLPILYVIQEADFITASINFLKEQILDSLPLECLRITGYDGGIL